MPRYKRRPSSWRRQQTQFRLRRFLRRLRLAVTVVVAVFLTLGVLWIWNLLNPRSLAGTSFRATEWDGSSPMNLLYLELSDPSAASPSTRAVAILSFNPTQETFTAFFLPMDYGKLSDLYGLGNLSGGGGLERVAHEVREILGIAVDDYLVVSSSGAAELAALFPDAGPKDFVSFQAITHLPELFGLYREELQTSLTAREILSALWYLAFLRADRTEVLTLTPELLDDLARLDFKLSPYLRDEKLAAEHLKIQVLNGSGRGGVASSAARVIRNLGGEVIRVDNFARQDLVKGYLILESSGSYTAKRLSEIFGVFDSRPPQGGAEARADITLVLGSEND